MKSIKLSILCILATCATNAQVRFILSGYATRSTVDYALGQPVSFSFTLKNGFDFTTDSYFSSTDNNWNEESATHDQLWSSVSGTGMGGAYTRPMTSFIDPSSAIAVHSSGAFGVFQINAGADEVTSNIGLSVASGPVRRIQVNLESGGPGFTYTGAYVEPSSFFQDFLGSYSVTGQMYLLTGAVYNEFSATSLTIIPEPSSVAFAWGYIAIFCAVMTIRNRKK